MPVGNNKPVSYFSLSKKNGGSLRYKEKDTDQEFFYDYIQGVLVGIELKDDVYEGKKINKYYFKFEPADHSSIEFLTIGEDASAARGLIAALVTIPDEDIHQIQVRPYTTTNVHEGEEKTFVNVDVSYRRNEAQPWIRLIDLEDTKPLYRKIFKNMPGDKQPRRHYVERMVVTVKDRLNTGPSNKTSEFVDQNGEIHDGRDHADNLYGGGEKGQPGNRPTPHRPVQQNIGSKQVDPFADMDDDLPF